MKRLSVDRVLVGVGSTLLVGLVAWFSLSREGSLAWDDSDYLRDGLHCANQIRSGWANHWALPIDVFLDIRPKPPLLVAWIATLSLILGTKDPLVLIFLSSVVPFALLVASVVHCTNRLAGLRGSLLAVLGLAALPLTLSYGPRVMVETFLSLWVLLVYYYLYNLTKTAARPAAIKLGIALGLLALTKLTFVLFILVPTLVAAVMIGQRHGLGLLLRRAGGAALVMGVVAGPWYVMNGRVAAKFASFSSRYQLVALGDPSIVATKLRLFMEFRDLIGWPLFLATTGAIAIVAIFGRSNLQSRDLPGFFIFTIAGATSAALALLYPAYFDTRFLIPVGPVLVVALAPLIGRSIEIKPWFGSLTFAGLIAWGSFLSLERMNQIPRSTTFWATRTLIDTIVDRTQAKTIYNVGNCQNWNVSKSGLCNELRDDPDACFVLHDLSSASAEDVPRRLAKADAVIVIDRHHVPAEWFDYGPGLNKGCDLVAETLVHDPHFQRLNGLPLAGLPPMEVYVRVK